VWNEAGNLANQWNGPLTNEQAKVIEIAGAVNAIHQVWMPWLQTILEDALHVRVI
jgi:hypothetical protein